MSENFVKERQFWHAIFEKNWNDWVLFYGDQMVPFPIAHGGAEREENVRQIVDLLNADDNVGSLLTAFICLACDVDGPL